jgi:energy-coupling factor transport system ATP-binding protein
MDLLAQLRAERRHTLVIVEHRLDEVMRLVDRVVVLSADGELVADGPPREVMRAHGPALRAAGVWTPQASELALRLESDGIELDPFPLTIPEAAQALRPYVELLNGNGEPLTPRRPLPCAGEGEPISASRTIPSCNGRSSSPAPLPLSAPERGPGGEFVPPLLAVRGLSYSYPRRARPVLKDVHLNIEAGELVAIVGANGAGKSTLARLIAGIVPAPPGAIFVQGRDVADRPPRELGRDVGYVFQYPEHQFVGQTVADDVAYGPRRAGLSEADARARANAMLDDFGLLRLAAAHPFTLSHGEQRRLSVASMLVLGQRLLILDEPTFGQDQKNAAMLLDKLERLAADGRAIVVVTHDMRLVAERARRVLVLVDGSPAFDGPPAELFADRALVERAHLVEPPLWELSRRLGLAVPLRDPEDAASRLRDATAAALALGGASPL